MYSILLVDDEKTIREYLPKAIPFQKYGFEVTDTAMNGQEALDKLSTIKPDLILLDIRMPIMDGLQFLKILRQGEFSNTLVIMLSGYKDFDYAKEAMKYGVKAYLNKPVDEDEIVPLLEEVREELDKYATERSFGLLREHIKKLGNLYNGAGVDREIFYGYTLMSCVLLPCLQNFGDKNPRIIIQECLSEVLGELENYLFRTNNNYFTLLLPPKVFEPFNNDKKLFANNLLKMFKEHKIDCSILFDSYIFDHAVNTFKEDFTNHMNEMLTELFFSSKEFIDYNPASFKIGEKLYCEYKYLEEIKQHFLLRNKAELLKVIEDLITEIQKVHLGIQYIQEISYRIYYVLLDGLAVSSAQDQNETILARPEWFDYPYFISFKRWRELLLSLVYDGLDFLEHRCEMVKLGISREVIEYVHMHYKDQITLKQVADKFFVNATYLGRVFKKVTGVNFKQYLNNIRIAEAKKLLLYTNKPIYEIANEVGYSESKYFVVKFREEVGKSPKEYRDQV